MQFQFHSNYSKSGYDWRSLFCEINSLEYLINQNLISLFNFITKVFIHFSIGRSEWSDGLVIIERVIHRLVT